MLSTDFQKTTSTESITTVMRKITKKEISLICKIIKENDFFGIPLNSLPALHVEDADDGGMGGIIFISKNQDRRLGKDIGTHEFNDADGVKVIATLSLDDFGDLYELDIWKTDFSRLIEMPDFSD